jgi:hypothetical protein
MYAAASFLRAGREPNSAVVLRARSHSIASASYHLDEATRRIAVVISQAQEAGEMDPELPTMDLARFILNSLYGAISRSKTDRTERPMKLLQQFALEPFVVKKR